MKLLDLLDKLAPDVQAAFLAAIEDVRSEAQMALIVRHISEGNIEQALNALNLRPEFFAPLDDALRAAYLQGGTEALAGLPLARLKDPFPAAAWLLGSMAEIRAQKRS